MGIYIKNWSLADWKELLMWARIGANNAMIGEFAEVEEIQPHGRLIDAVALDVIGYCGIPQGYEDTFDDGVMWLAEQIDLLPTIIPADESNMDSFIRIFEEDDEEDGMDSFIRILKD